MKRRYDYDVLRVCSMFGVIYLHIASGALRSLNYPVLWNVSNIFACIATPAVPLFFMMSGALLLQEEKTADLKYLFQKRIPKVLLPLLTYSFLFLLYSAIRNNTAGALEGLSRLLNTPVSVPYWFLYALIPMYLLSPMLKKMCDGLSDAHWRYMISLWIFLTLGLYTVRSFVPPQYELIVTEHWTLNINMVGGYLGYFLLGAYLERWETLLSRKTLATVVGFMLLLSIVGTRWDTYTRMYYSDRFTNYLTCFTMVLASAIFLLAKSCLREKEEKGKILPLLSGVSFAVYLIHPLAIGLGEKLWTYFTGTLGPGTILQQAFFFLAVSLFCVLAAVILASIPGICYLFTGQNYHSASKSCNLKALFSPRKKPR